jgi:hypothetical protein
MANTTTLACAKSDCNVMETGTCAEGHKPPASCPYYGNVPGTGAVEDDDDSDENVSSDVNRIRLPSGNFLNAEEFDEFLCWRSATLIAVVGLPASGKTTLLCALLERFLKGPFAGHLCAGSRTIIGFERRAHESRIASGRTEPDTKRTTISDGLTFAHLAMVESSEKAVRTDLVLSDRAGEIYSRVQNNSSHAAELLEVSKAQIVLLLMDGKRLADPALRSGAMQGVRQMLRAFIDAKVIGGSSVVQVVTTMVDLLEEHEDKDLIETRVTEFRNNLTRDFGSKVAELTYWNVAARDPHGRVPAAFGLAELVVDWTRSRERILPLPLISVPLETQRDKLLVRTGIGAIP